MKRTTFWSAGLAAIGVAVLFFPTTVARPPIVSTIEINRPAQDVFNYVTTPANWPKWHPSSLRVAGATDHPLNVGEQAEEQFIVAGRDGKALWTVVEKKFPERWVIQGKSENGGGGATITYQLTAMGDITGFRREMIYFMPNLLTAALDRLMLHDKIVAESESALRNLKKVLETRPGA